MRFVRVVLALAFGLAMAGPETHQCPVHDHAVPAATAHHGPSPDHDQNDTPKHCTCPQACCPIGVGVSLPAASPSEFDLPETTRFTAVAIAHSVLLSPRKHALPLAQAPPLTL
jgi:hypothetical protein